MLHYNSSVWCTKGVWWQRGPSGTSLKMCPECPRRIELSNALLARCWCRSPAGSMLSYPRDTEDGPPSSALLDIDCNRPLGSCTHDRMRTGHVLALGMLEGHSFNPKTTLVLMTVLVFEASQHVCCTTTQTCGAHKEAGGSVDRQACQSRCA